MHFNKRIHSYIEEGKNKNKEPLTSLKELIAKINSAILVSISVKNHSDAYILFEILNDRGVPLTAIDLIKNKLLSKLSDPKKKILDESYYKRWKRVIELLGEDYQVQERFFRQYYNAFKSELGLDIPIAQKSNLIKVYDKLIDKDAEWFLNSIQDAAKLYRQIIGEEPVPGQEKLSNALKSLERIQGTPSYILLIRLFKDKEKLKLSYGHLEQIAHFLISFFVRRNTTDIPPTRDLIRIFMAVTDSIKEMSGDAIVNSIKESLTNKSVSDEIFKEKLRGDLYEDNKGVCRFVLFSLEEKYQTRERKFDLWEQSVWTIEHIFPQGENIPASWVDMMAQGNAELAKEYQQKYVHSLGNLTITGYNGVLSNKSFEEKQNGRDACGRNVGYNNGLYLNESLANSTSWSVEQIEERTEKLMNEIVEMFSLT